MNIREFQKVNSERAKRWHNNEEEPWGLTDWTNAMAGETGEACNVSKKLKRINTNLPNLEAGISVTDKEKLRLKLAWECADSIIYGILIINELGMDAATIIADVFDKKSEEYGFPERAPR